MNTSILISSSAVEAAPRTAKGEVVKLVQGALLAAVAAIAIVGIASVAAPHCVWKGEVTLFLNESFHTAYPVPAIAEYASARPGPIGRRCSWPCSLRRTLPTMPSGVSARALGSAARHRCSASACLAFSPR